MAELKTKPGDEDAEAFIHKLDDEKKKKDSLHLLKIMQEVQASGPEYAEAP